MLTVFDLKNLKCLSILLLLLNPFFFYSQTTSEEKPSKSIALEYMKAYGNWDFDAMKTFYDDNIHFEDLTAKSAFGQDYSFNGKENVYNFFQGVFKDAFKDGKPPYVNFKIEKVFDSEPFIIINSTFESLLPSSWFRNAGTENIFISIPFLTILEIKNGKIISHKDYGDYTTYKKQIHAQIMD